MFIHEYNGFRTMTTDFGEAYRYLKKVEAIVPGIWTIEEEQNCLMSDARPYVLAFQKLQMSKTGVAVTEKTDEGIIVHLLPSTLSVAGFDFRVDDCATEYYECHAAELNGSYQQFGDSLDYRNRLRQRVAAIVEYRLQDFTPNIHWKREIEKDRILCRKAPTPIVSEPKAQIKSVGKLVVEIQLPHGSFRYSDKNFVLNFVPNEKHLDLMPNTVAAMNIDAIAALNTSGPFRFMFKDPKKLVQVNSSDTAWLDFQKSQGRPVQSMGTFLSAA